MPPPYRKARGYGWIWAIFILTAVASMAPILMVTPESVGGWLFVFLTLPMIVGIVAAATIDHKLTKGRRLRMGSFLESLGLQFIHNPTPEAKTAFFEHIQHLERTAGLSGGANNLKWIAYGPIGGRQALIFEHEHITGSGRSTQVHNSTAVCWVSSLGWLTLIRPRIGEGRALERSHEEIHIADPVFDKNWIIWGEHETAASFITPSIIARLANSPRGELWCIGGGWSCCLFRYSLDERNLPKFIQRSGDVLFLG